MHAFGAVPKHRGRGLATLMNQASIKLAVQRGCDFLYAHMVIPETIHISEKAGYEVAHIDFMEEAMFEVVHVL
jgi:hypothetical protein